jgi:hypothetical protein
MPNTFCWAAAPDTPLIFQTTSEPASGHVKKRDLTFTPHASHFNALTVQRLPEKVKLKAAKKARNISAARSVRIKV